MINFIWINNLPEHYVLLNEGDKLDETTLYLSRNRNGNFETNLTPIVKEWSTYYFPAVRENTELEFLD